MKMEIHADPAFWKKIHGVNYHCLDVENQFVIADDSVLTYQGKRHRKICHLRTRKIMLSTIIRLNTPPMIL